jgi:hypothetical protein
MSARVKITVFWDVTPCRYAVCRLSFSDTVNGNNIEPSPLESHNGACLGGWPEFIYMFLLVSQYILNVSSNVLLK